MGFPRQEFWSGLPFPPAGDRTHVSCIGTWILHRWASKKPLSQLAGSQILSSRYSELLFQSSDSDNQMPVFNVTWTLLLGFCLTQYYCYQECVSQVAQWWNNMPAMQETQETRVWSLGWEDPLEKEIASHSSILAWEIPWTEEPGGLQFMGSQRDTTEWLTLHSPSFSVIRLSKNG